MKYKDCTCPVLNWHHNIAPYRSTGTLCVLISYNINNNMEMKLISESESESDQLIDRTS